jgi:N-acetyl-gamma-glutamyl-phosphate reductase
MKLAVGIIGVTGYSGQTLLSLLLKHPEVSLRYLAARRLEKPQPLGSVLPAFNQRTPLKIHPFKPQEAKSACDLLFLALPHGVAMEWVPGLLKKPSLRVVDLSGDFRLSAKQSYPRHYKFTHTAPALLSQAVYGLTEFSREAIASARLVANPGCYSTAALLALAPLARKRLLAPAGTVIDAKSGLSGAGKTLKTEMLFAQANENLNAYRVDAHQHTPEMEQTLKRWTRRNIRLTFVPHLVPMNRGIYATLYAPLSKGTSETTLRSIFQKIYADEPFVRLLPQGTWPQIHSVVGTNFCDLSVQLDRNNSRAIVIAAIDNLVKGAAGQAVQNMNLMYGFPETLGLK